MVALAFLELFVAGCIEVKQAAERKRGRLFKLAPGVDLELLEPLERLAASCLDTFRSFEEFLVLANEKISKDCEAGCQASGAALSMRDREIMAEMGAVIDEAVEYLPPSCSCSF